MGLPAGPTEGVTTRIPELEHLNAAGKRNAAGGNGSLLRATLPNVG